MGCVFFIFELPLFLLYYNDYLSGWVFFPLLLLAGLLQLMLSFRSLANE